MMTSFKIINDDVGLRGIHEDNKTPVISGPVMPVKATKPVQKSPENPQLNSTQPGLKGIESHQTQRRKTDRRKTDTHVLLETRSQHDRRVKIETISDGDENNEAISTLHGIDETI